MTKLPQSLSPLTPSMQSFSPTVNMLKAKYDSNKATAVTLAFNAVDAILLTHGSHQLLSSPIRFPVPDMKKKKKKSKAWAGLIIMLVPLVVLLSCYWIYKNIDFKEIQQIQKLVLLQMRRMRRFYINLQTDKNMNTELR